MAGETSKRPSARVIITVVGGLILALMVMDAVRDNDEGKERSRSAPSSTSSSTKAAKKDGCGSVGPTCDVVPKVDGIYRVAGDGLFSTGIMSGWIETAGPRMGSDHCTWVRLSGPKVTIENTIDMEKTTGGGPVKVLIAPTDVAFASYGCAQWKRP